MIKCSNIACKKVDFLNTKTIHLKRINCFTTPYIINNIMEKKSKQSLLSVENRKMLDLFCQELKQRIPDLEKIGKLLHPIERAELMQTLKVSIGDIHFVGYIYQQILSFLEETTYKYDTLRRTKHLGMINHLCDFHFHPLCKKIYEDQKYFFSTINNNFFEDGKKILLGENYELSCLLDVFDQWKIALDEYILMGKSGEERGPKITLVQKANALGGDSFFGSYIKFGSYNEYEKFIGEFDKQMKKLLKFYSEETYHCMVCHSWFGSIACYQSARDRTLHSRTIPNFMKYRVTDRSYHDHIPDLKTMIPKQERIDEETYVLCAMETILFPTCETKDDYEMLYKRIVDNILNKSKPIEEFHARLSQLQNEVIDCYKNHSCNILSEKEWMASVSTFQLLSIIFSFELGRGLPHVVTENKVIYNANGRTPQKSNPTFGDIPIKVAKQYGKKKN